jgi:hypothetical protein
LPALLALIVGYDGIRLTNAEVISIFVVAVLINGAILFSYYNYMKNLKASSLANEDLSGVTKLVKEGRLRY